MMAEVTCTHCGMYVDCSEDGDIERHESKCGSAPMTRGELFPLFVELEVMRKQVAEMHAMMTQVSLVLRQMESHPMLSAFMPRLG